MMTVSDTHVYTLHFFGTLRDDFVTDYCPAGTALTMNERTFTLINLRTDQAGMLGILRHLHNSGCLLLALAIENRESETTRNMHLPQSEPQR
ncbi:hypothetical protein [Roseiflexus sp.]|uniref:hypothetical protein n=1 Tax=Roseiflexus sp. TaxID=2562120 RepID=UPI00398AF7A7